MSSPAVNISYSIAESQSGESVAVSGGISTIMATTLEYHAKVSVATSAALVSFGAVTNAGYAILRNEDDTNYIQLALDSGITQIFATLDPCSTAGDVRTGGFALLKPGAPVYAKAHTGACQMLVQVVTNPT